jgi:hypothetical protein
MGIFKLDQEKLVKEMILLYCNKNHNTKNELCESCSELFGYVQKRLKYCPYGDKKPVCFNCKIHCYRKEYKDRIKDVMKFSGPKIMFHNPIAGIKYLFKKKVYDKLYYPEIKTKEKLTIDN